MIKDKTLLRTCHDAWCNLSLFRSRRSRYKDFAYGRQWDDTIRLPNGRIVTECQTLVESGRLPITNNLIRQLLKSIIGRYRYLSTDIEGEDTDALRSVFSTTTIDPVRDTDARTLEEFLISGCAVQRVAPTDEPDAGHVANVSPDRIFFTRFEESCAGDCRMIGMLHDMTITDILRRFSHADPDTALALMSAVANTPRGGYNSLTTDAETDFHATAETGLRRVIEVWRKIPSTMLRCHDTEDATYTTAPLSDENISRIATLNMSRRSKGMAEIITAVSAEEVWQQTWLLPDGTILDTIDRSACHSPAIVISLYPMIDGEVHSLVEDIIGQQKYVNRLVTLLDDVLSNSAKGAVLYPADQLPDGMTWSELRKLWSSPAAIIPFKRTSSRVMPTQIQNAGSAQGASDMLKLQLQLFNEIAGNSDALRGAGNPTGAEMLRRQTENATLAMLDILASFHTFTQRRDALRK